MLTSLVLTLRAKAASTLPAYLGRATQAILLDLIARRDPRLAAALHDTDGVKPITASNLVMEGRRHQYLRPVEAGQEGWLRFTGLHAIVSEHLRALADAPPPTIEMDGLFFTMTGATLDPAAHPWAAQTTYEELAAPYLLLPRPKRSIVLEFVSPTTFKSSGRYIPLPLPELVFGSLADRWQAFAPLALHPETRHFAGEGVVISEHQLRSQSVAYGPDKRVTFTGQATFTTLSRDPYWQNVLHLLADFAFYSGIGYQTSTGLGQARRRDRPFGFFRG
jgi:CRISPR-associated endoribonuclease Cas6